MPLFVCSKCKCIENTATCHYWSTKDISKVLCTACDPEIGKWHGIFPKKKYEELKDKSRVLNPPK